MAARRTTSRSGSARPSPAAASIRESGTGVAVRQGAAKPDIARRRVEEGLLAAKSIGYSTGPSRVYTRRIRETCIRGPISRAGQADPSGVFVGTLIASGEPESASSRSASWCIPGIDYSARCAGELQRMTMFSARHHAGAKQATKRRRSSSSSPRRPRRRHPETDDLEPAQMKRGVSTLLLVLARRLSAASRNRSHEAQRLRPQAVAQSCGSAPEPSLGVRPTGPC